MEASGPAARLLLLLELLQDRPGMPGPELAGRLGVSGRTVRRYVTTLQDMGIPVEPTRGRVGGYRLRRGYRMPPLMMSTDEAVAVTLALATSPSTSGGSDAGPTATALAKLTRVLPRDTAGRVATVLETISTAPGHPRRGNPDPALLVTLAEAIAGRRRCHIAYGSGSGDPTVRDIEPYGVAALYGAWYVHGWCCLRQAPRTFRLDRIESCRPMSTTFTPPQDFDVLAAVQEGLALGRSAWSITLLVAGALDEVAPWVPREFALLEPVDATTTRLRSSTARLDYFVSRVSDLPFPMTVVEPPELRDAFRRHADRMRAVAERPVVNPAGV